MKKFLIALLSVVICVAFAVGLTACADSTKNPDGTPKNMAETIIDISEGSSSNLYCWGDHGNMVSASLEMGNISKAFGEGTDYNKYSSFSFMWKKNSEAYKYKITKLEFDITSQTPAAITVDCNIGEAITNGSEFQHLNEVTINNGETVHISFNNLNCVYSKYATSVQLKNNGRTTDKSVLNWQIKISNLFITAEKV